MENAKEHLLDSLWRDVAMRDADALDRLLSEDEQTVIRRTALTQRLEMLQLAQKEMTGFSDW